MYCHHYHSPLGEILLAADDIGLTGLWFQGQKHFPHSLASYLTSEDLPAFLQARQRLDIYLSGQEPAFQPPLHLIGTPFQMEVWEILRTIPYGKTSTYGAIAKQLAMKRGPSQMSSQAVGGAVGRNPVSIIVPPATASLAAMEV